MNSRFVNTRRNIFSGVLFKLISIVLPFLLRTVMIYTMGAEYTGLSSLFASILRVLSLAELGLQNVIIFCLYKPIADNNTEKICGILSYYRKIYFRIGLIILSCGLLITPFITILIHGGWSEDINIYLVYVIYLVNTSISYMMFAYKGTLLNAHQRIDIVNTISMSVFTGQYVIQIAVLYLFRNYYLYIIFTPIATIAINIIQAIVTDKKYPQYRKKAEIETETIEMIKKGIKGTILEHITDATRSSFDSIVISASMGLTAVTLYSNYFYVISSVFAVMLSVTSGMTASIGDSIAIESKDYNYVNLRKFTFLFNIIVTFSASCILCVYQDFMELWTGSNLVLPFSNAVIFVIYYYMLNIKAIRDIYYGGSGLWWEGRFSFILESGFNILLNVILVKYLGILGVCFASIITIIAFNFIMRTNILFKNYFNMNPKEYYCNHFVYIVCGIFIGIIACLISSLVDFDFLALRLVIKGLLSAVISGVLILLIYRKNQNWKYAVQYLKRFIGKGAR